MTFERLKTLTGHKMPVLSIALSKTEPLLLSGGGDSRAIVWNILDGSALAEFSCLDSWAGTVAFDPLGRTMAIAFSDKKIQFVDLRTLRTVFEIDDLPALVGSIAYSPDGKFFCAALYDNTVKVWLVEGLIQQKILSHHDKPVRVAVFDPASRIIASGGRDRSICVSGLENGGLIRRLEGHSDFVLSLAFNAKGNQLLSSSKDKTVRLWDLASGTELWRNALPDEASSVAFARNCQLALVSLYDGGLAAINASTGELLTSVRAHNDWCISVIAQESTEIIATASGDKTVALWRLID